jgi:hypothetical protein
VFFWVETTVNQAELVAMSDGYLHHCTAANDVLQMFDEVFRFFYELSRLGDPACEELTVPKFCSLLQDFSEHFLRCLFNKAKITSGLSATTFVPHLHRWLVCYSTMQQFLQVLSSFWTRNVNQDLLRDEGFYDVTAVLAKTSIILADTKRSLSELVDSCETYVLDQIHAWAVTYLSVVNSATPGLTTRDFCDSVFNEFSSVIAVVGQNVEDKYVPSLVQRTIKVCLAAFDKRLLSQTSKPLSNLEKDEDLEIIATLEEVASSCAKHFHSSEPDVLGFISSTRHLLHLCCQPSTDLVASLTDRKKKVVLSVQETESLHFVLSMRKDKEAQNYLRTVPKKP